MAPVSAFQKSETEVLDKEEQVLAAPAHSVGLLRAVQIRAALLMRMETESERVESNTGVVFGWGACGGMSMDVRIRLRVNKHAGGP